MDKEKVLKIIGISSVAIGSGCLYFAGVGEAAITGLVGAIFMFIGIILGFFKKA